jgi:hypothetical protein
MFHSRISGRTSGASRSPFLTWWIWSSAAELSAFHSPLRRWEIPRFLLARLRDSQISSLVMSASRCPYSPWCASPVSHSTSTSLVINLLAQHLSNNNQAAQRLERIDPLIIPGYEELGYLAAGNKVWGKSHLKSSRPQMIKKASEWSPRSSCFTLSPAVVRILLWFVKNVAPFSPGWSTFFRANPLSILLCFVPPGQSKGWVLSRKRTPHC